ncbi:hypothetical protein I3843_01G052600 [Carya illinoinensis]|uniref:Uncharacterized protein n=1 Tax=Carya illinoinensis TaxID=32201 RepID=A0A922FQX1_CARIL|nr:hypothetical protein I3760_13G115600 [Carya illinoinensis]KAG6723960.1 hypothetical protein I3842_03G234700 [Carya illinoinensis]KAG7994322.1 hypothetical protein I3843_01G052600 [Carya illinoinensis]
MKNTNTEQETESAIVINGLSISINGGSTKLRRPIIKIVALGFDEKFIRTWKYYFEYCPAGFKSCTLGVYQVFRDIISRLLSLDSSKDWRTYIKDWWTYTMHSKFQIHDGRTLRNSYVMPSHLPAGGVIGSILVVVCLFWVDLVEEELPMKEMVGKLTTNIM